MADRPARRRSSLAEEHPAYSATSSTPTSPAATAAAEASHPSEQSAAPMPPPRRRRTARVQLNTRVRQDLHDQLQTFVDQHDAAVQDVVETALAEYFERRS